MSQGSERLRLQRQCPKAYCSWDNNVARLDEIGLATKMLWGLLISGWQCCKARRDYACNKDVTRVIALVTTMSRGSLRSRLQWRCREAYCSRNDDVGRLVEIALATKMSQGLLLSWQQCSKACWDCAINEDAARLIAFATTMLWGS